MSTGIWVAIIGAVVMGIAWFWMAGTMFGAGLFGFGLAHVVLGLIDAALNRQRADAPALTEGGGGGGGEG